MYQTLPNFELQTDIYHYIISDKYCGKGSWMIRKDRMMDKCIRKKTNQGREPTYYALSDINKFNTVKYFLYLYCCIYTKKL